MEGKLEVRDLGGRDDKKIIRVNLYKSAEDLRDYFAGQYLHRDLGGYTGQNSLKDIAHDAYALADAMMEARKK